ncbi:MAG: diacylglycerol kinase family protein [Mycoplasmataceae bacterium]|nr:diacylglycerol kinase family protein [Mycoplasmataceae bacterium]
MINWIKRVNRKFANAFRGLIVLIKEEKSLWVHFFVSFIVIVFGIFLFEEIWQWISIILVIGLVIGFEIINTSIEYIVDIISFEYNVKAKKIKDVAATATLFVTLVAIVVGLLVFLPLIIDILKVG